MKVNKGKREETKRKESLYAKNSEIKSDFHTNKPMFGDETKRKQSFYVKKSEIESVFHTNKPMFVLLYKETLLNINDLDSSLPSFVSSLL